MFYRYFVDVLIFFVVCFVNVQDGNSTTRPEVGLQHTQPSKVVAAHLHSGGCLPSHQTPKIHYYMLFQRILLVQRMTSGHLL